jgi:hypothetical protein
MSRRRRSIRTPAPKGLNEITGTERALWGCQGPIVEGDAFDLRGRPVPAGEWHGYQVWPSWQVFFGFYGHVRAEWLARRQHMSEPLTEALYAAWQAGQRDIDAVRDDLVARQPDPRAALMQVRR